MDNDYKSLEEYGISLPVLVLAIDRRPNNPTYYNFKSKRQWLKVRHQTAGYACHQCYMEATILTPREPGKIIVLANEYLDSCINMWGLTLDAVITYRQRLNQLFGVDCNETFMSLEEGIYPVDATYENLRKLCKDRLPKDLDNLIIWESNSDKSFGFIGRWKVYILGENCD
jgi:hypothetical protein